MTLIELLVVISIIGILAGLILPAVANAKIKAKVAAAKHDIQGIYNAIVQYRQEYSQRYPLWTQVNFDVTFGDGTTVIGTPIGGASYLNNQTLSILMAATNFPNATATLNAGHAYNPRKVPLLNAKVLDASNVTGNGIGGDGVYRDPWQNPYIISMDTDQNGYCTDVFYSQSAVSASSANASLGINGLVLDPNGTGKFVYRAEAMVWSFGPDQVADATVKADANRADGKGNKDNVCSWKP